MSKFQKVVSGYRKYITYLMVVIPVAICTDLYAEEETFDRRRFEKAFGVRDFAEIKRVVTKFPLASNMYLSLGLMPLHLAWNESVTTLLIQAGADMEAQELFELDTPLHEAVQQGKVEVVEALIRHGANVNARNEKMNTPLHDAAKVGPLEIAELLIANGTDVDAAGFNKATPLHYAAISGNDDAVELLIRHGADVTAQNKDGETPLHDAVLSGDLQLVKLFIDHGAEIDAKDIRGHTPLYNALQAKQYDIVELLLDHHAEVGATEQSLIMELALREYAARRLPEKMRERRIRLIDLLGKNGAYRDLYDEIIGMVTEY